MGLGLVLRIWCLHKKKPPGYSYPCIPVISVPWFTGACDVYFLSTKNALKNSAKLVKLWAAKHA